MTTTTLVADEVTSLTKSDPASVHFAKEISAAYVATKQGLRRAIYFGFVCLEAKEQIAHGQFEHWLTAHCPEIPLRTVRHFMQITEGVHGQLPKRQQLPFSKTRELLSFPDDQVPKDAEPARDAILDFIDGKSQRQLMITLKSNSPSGGFRPPEEAVQKWLKKHHPKLAGTTYAELCIHHSALATQFKRQFKPEAPSAAMRAEAARARFDKCFEELSDLMDGKAWTHADEAQRKAAKEIAHDAHEKLCASLNKKKGAK